MLTSVLSQKPYKRYTLSSDVNDKRLSSKPYKRRIISQDRKTKIELQLGELKSGHEFYDGVVDMLRAYRSYDISELVMLNIIVHES